MNRQACPDLEDAAECIRVVKAQQLGRLLCGYARADPRLLGQVNAEVVYQFSIAADLGLSVQVPAHAARLSLKCDNA